MNRRVMADDDKAVIIGSNYQMPPKNRMALFDRFAVVAETERVVTTNANSNANNK